jgi:DNA-binding transcriptional regulator YhcF (GntR family)
MPLEVDPASPVPLYHQIAEALRARMERGELRQGDALEPMRKAAEHWGVNLHTVRHAYAALAREGLLEMRSARGTRVTAAVRRLRRPAEEGPEEFAVRVAREAAERFQLTPRELAALIATRGGSSGGVVAVVECSAWQCASHAAEIAARWRVEARPWPLTDAAEPEGDFVVATYFHYNDIRRRWPHLLGRVRFLTIRVAPEVEEWLGGAPSAVVVERDEPTAEAVAADLRAAFAREVDLQLTVTDDPDSVIDTLPDARLLFSPRMWSELSEASRANERCSVVRYEFDGAELEAVARECGWERLGTEGRDR